MLNRSLSPVNFNQSTQQVEPLLKKEEELEAVLAVTTKAHRLRDTIFFYYSLQKEGSCVTVGKPFLSMSLNCVATNRFSTLKSQLVLPTKTWCFVCVPPAVFRSWGTCDSSHSYDYFFFLPLPSWDRNPVFNGTMHRDCSHISNPASTHQAFLPCTYHHPNSATPQSSIWTAVNRLSSQRPSL